MAGIKSKSQINVAVPPSENSHVARLEEIKKTHVLDGSLMRSLPDNADVSTWNHVGVWYAKIDETNIDGLPKNIKGIAGLRLKLDVAEMPDGEIKRTVFISSEDSLEDDTHEINLEPLTQKHPRIEVFVNATLPDGTQVQWTGLGKTIVYNIENDNGSIADMNELNRHFINFGMARSWDASITPTFSNWTMLANYVLENPDVKQFICVLLFTVDTNIWVNSPTAIHVVTASEWVIELLISDRFTEWSGASLNEMKVHLEFDGNVEWWLSDSVNKILTSHDTLQTWPFGFTAPDRTIPWSTATQWQRNRIIPLETALNNFQRLGGFGNTPVNVTDFNAVTTPGSRIIAGNPLNRPPSTLVGTLRRILHVTALDNNVLIQELEMISTGAGTPYECWRRARRSVANTNWTPWVHISRSDALPNIVQVRVPGDMRRVPHNNTGSGTTALNASRQVDVGATIILDRPAPANCFIQFHRYSGRTGSRGYNNHGWSGRRIRKAFRPIDINSARFHGQNYWILRVPHGASEITTAPLRQLYRPPRLRGPNSGATVQLTRTPENLYRGLGFRNLNTNAVNRRYANKCTYKFSVVVMNSSHTEVIASGSVSADTLEIMNWITNPRSIILSIDNNDIDNWSGVLNVPESARQALARVY